MFLVLCRALTWGFPCLDLGFQGKAEWELVPARQHVLKQSCLSSSANCQSSHSPKFSSQCSAPQGTLNKLRKCPVLWYKLPCCWRQTRKEISLKNTGHLQHSLSATESWSGGRCSYKKIQKISQKNAHCKEKCDVARAKLFMWNCTAQRLRRH